MKFGIEISRILRNCYYWLGLPVSNLSGHRISSLRIFILFINLCRWMLE